MGRPRHPFPSSFWQYLLSVICFPSRARAVVAWILCLVRFCNVYIAWGAVGDSTGDAAKNSSKSTHTLVSHDYHEGAVCVRLFDERLRGRAVDREVVDLQPLRAKFYGDITRNFFSIAGFGDHQLVAAGSHDLGTVAAEGSHHMKSCTHGRSEAACCFCRPLGGFAAVNAYDDYSSHPVLFLEFMLNGVLKALCLWRFARSAWTMFRQ